MKKTAAFVATLLLLIAVAVVGHHLLTIEKLYRQAKAAEFAAESHVTAQPSEYQPYKERADEALVNYRSWSWNRAQGTDLDQLIACRTVTDTLNVRSERQRNDLQLIEQWNDLAERALRKNMTDAARNALDRARALTAEVDAEFPNPDSAMLTFKLCGQLTGS